MFEIDAGNEGGGGGPFINWHVQENDEGTAAAKTFSLKDGDDRTDITDRFKKGVILDVENLKTGWGQYGMPWEWNDTIAHMKKRPDGDGWKKGFSMMVALGDGKAGLWQQHGAGVFLALTNLAPQLADGEKGKLPKVKMKGAEKKSYGEGKGSTFFAKLEVVGWVDRPDCLKEQDAPIDTGEDDDDTDGF
tara:strand:- start:153 stop:722 length:570 start_codon:yes stop_codon:yes gene_type:complete